MSMFSSILFASPSDLFSFRANASLTASQNLVQSLKDEVTKIRTEKDNLQKELDAKVADIQEKVKTITQVKKIGRRYKTQYEELKAQHDKVDRTEMEHSLEFLGFVQNFLPITCCIKASCESNDIVIR